MLLPSEGKASIKRESRVLGTVVVAFVCKGMGDLTDIQRGMIVGV